MSLGQRLKAARVAGGYPQSELADILGVTQTAVSYWESDRNEPPIAALVIYAQWGRTSIDALVGA